MRARINELLPNSVFVSAVSAGGLDSLKDSLLKAVLLSRPVVELRVPLADGRLLAQVYREGEVLSRETEDEMLVLRVRAESGAIGRLVASGANRIID
jgi:GTP-binding protein HflX